MMVSTLQKCNALVILANKTYKACLETIPLMPTISIDERKIY